MYVFRNTAARCWLAGVLLLAIGPPLAPAETRLAPPQLTAEQEAAAHRLDGMLMAPCCFANTLADHQSPVASDLRSEIRIMLADGAAEAEIVDAMVAKYGERILAAPAARGFNLLAYVIPAVVLGAGLVVIAVVLRRRRAEPPPVVVGGDAGSPAAADRVRARFEEELARFDA